MAGWSPVWSWCWTMSVRPKSPFPLANKCLRAAMAACNCRHSSLVGCGAARFTNPFTSSLSSRLFLELAPGSARTRSAMATTSPFSMWIGSVPVLANQMLLSCSTSTIPRTGHSPNGPGPFTIPLALGVGTITLTCVTVCGASVADPTARTARVSSVTALTSVTEWMVHGRRSPMCPFPVPARSGRYTAPSHGRTMSSCAIAKSFPNIPSSSLLSVTMKLHFMTRVPRVTVSRALHRHSSARPSTEHSRPQYLVSSSSARPHFLHVRAARMDTPDPVSTRKLTPFPSIRPGRYSPFPTMTDSSVLGSRVYCDSGDCPFPKTELLQLDPSLLLAVPASVLRSPSRGRRGRSWCPEVEPEGGIVHGGLRLDTLPLPFFFEEYLGICLHARGHHCSVQRRSNTAATSVTTVPLSVCYRGAKPLGPCGCSNFVPCGWPFGHARGVRGPKSTVPSSAILIGSVAAERSYRALGTLAPGFPILVGGLWDRGLMLVLCPFFL